MKTLSKEKKSIVGYVIIGVCFVVFSFLIISAVTLNKREYDPETFCTENIEAHTIVVLDKTDPFSANQQKFILNYINREKDQLRPFEKFSVFTLTENTYSSPEPLFSKCNPGTGEKANQLYQNPRKIQMRFDEFFLKPLEENMKNMLVNNTGSKSPILEMIKELSLRKDFGEEVKKRTLIIISDLMHHTAEYSHYKNRIDYECFSRKSYAYDVAAVLDSVNVKIVYLLRNNLNRIQGERHMSFWENYFEEMGAEIVDVKKVR
ncbi:MAG: hypothetical protein PVG39_22735 [Desulfobacteraceae bacterium]|jgi:hypothetical protein